MTVPPVVQCIQVVTQGSAATTTNLSVTVGSSSATLTVGRLPFGTLQFTASAFDSACSAIAGTQPTWVADPVSATLRAGVPTTVTLTFRQNIPIVASANFVQNTVSIAGSSDNVNAGTYMVMTDGTIRTAGSPVALGSPSLTFASSTASASATGVLAVAAGAFHVCFIKKADGSVWCAGSNASGQVGPGVAMGGVASSPVQVTFPTGTGAARAIVAGELFTCAIAETGALGSSLENVFCWGDNTFGQLGRNNLVASSNAPMPVITPGTIVGMAGVPLHVNGAVLASAGVHACIGGDAFDGASGVWCWGSNQFAQLGDNTTTNRPAAVSASGAATDTVGLALGDRHTCSLGATGLVQCWGDNGFGEIGDGTFTSRLAPTGNGITDATQIVAGSTFFTCALHRGGTVSCWGFNDVGQLGIGSAAASVSSPTLLGLSGVASLAAGPSSAYALLTNGTIQAWGYNVFGGLGDGTEVTRFLPVPVLVQ
jgi:alpha-tubulin suppressor-like RCC1 family protein